MKLIHIVSIHRIIRVLWNMMWLPCNLSVHILNIQQFIKSSLIIAVSRVVGCGIASLDIFVYLGYPVTLLQSM